MNLIITGGTSGMGLAAVKHFLQRGHQVLFVGRNRERGEALLQEFRGEFGNRCFFFQGDVTKKQDVERLHDFAREHLGRVDSLINNAGIFVGGRLHETTEEDWDRVFAADVKSVFLMSRAFLPDMMAQGRGTIVNTASVSGLAGDYAMAAYNAAKGALVNLARSMALDYGKYGIRVNNVCPGACATPMFLANPPEVQKKFREANPLGRVCTPEEVAEAMYFLAGDASSSCNGINLELSGGMNVHTGQPAQ